MGHQSSIKHFLVHPWIFGFLAETIGGYLRLVDNLTDFENERVVEASATGIIASKDKHSVFADLACGMICSGQWDVSSALF